MFFIIKTINIKTQHSEETLLKLEKKTFLKTHTETKSSWLTI